jgi:hypothetical protein
VSAKPALGVRLARRWVNLYTRSLPRDVAERRRAEIESDLWEQVHDEGSIDRVADAVLGRCLRGIPADVWWRYHTLLAERGARERSREMIHNLKSDWWPPLVVLYALGATASVTVPILANDEPSSVAIVVAVTVTVVAGAVMLAGLVVRHRHAVAGSWMIAVGAVPGLASVLLPVGLAVLIGGVWTGNLAFRTTAPDLVADLLVVERRTRLTGHWWRWILVAAVLAGLGFAVLYAGDLAGGLGSEQEPTMLGGVVWAAWLLSWVAAAITATTGAVLAAMQFIVRHHTRHA